MILDADRLMEVIPNYFLCTKYESFVKQLKGWGFKRIQRPGPGASRIDQSYHIRSEMSLLIISLCASSPVGLFVAPDFGCYYHEAFLRDAPNLACLIRRQPASISNSVPLEDEPNFYQMS